MQVFSTQAVAPPERFSYWREVLTQHFIHLRPERAGCGPFAGLIEAQELAGHSFSRVTTGHQRIHRGTREIAGSPHDLVFVNLQLEGRGSYRQGGPEREVQAGDLFVISAVDPFELGVERPLRQLTLRLPRERLDCHLGRSERGNGAFIPRGSRAGALLGDLMLTLWRGTIGAVAPDGGDTVEHLLALTGYAVAPDSARRRWPTAAGHAGLYARALRAIDRRSAEPGLVPRALAASLGVSLRTLQGIFARHGDAIERRIQRARLAQATRLLADPALCGRAIGELALAAGFNELSHFTRAFVRRHGRTPGAWRRERLRRGS